MDTHEFICGESLFESTLDNDCPTDTREISMRVSQRWLRYPLVPLRSQEVDDTHDDTSFERGSRDGYVRRRVDGYTREGVPGWSGADDETRLGRHGRIGWRVGEGGIGRAGR